MFKLIHVSVFFATICFVSTVAAQTTFDWGFGENFSGQDFAECQTLSIFVESSHNNLGVPPYYMMAFEVGGVPTTTNIGSNPSQLSWRNTHRQGSSLMMTVIDSSGNVGGIPGTLYTISPGTDTSCLSPVPDPSQVPTVTPNVTDNLATCDEWGLAVTGGQKPYTIVLSALDSPVVTNITMGTADDVLTWPNRASPGGQLMASVVDANGNWGISSSIVHTSGSANTGCGNLAPSSSSQQVSASPQGTSSQAPSASSQPSSTAKSNQQHLPLWIGIGVGCGVVALLVLALIIYLCLRRRSRRQEGVWDTPSPKPWQTPPQQSYEPTLNPQYSPYAADPRAAPYPAREVDAASQFTAASTFKHPAYGYGRESPSATPFMPPATLYADHGRTSSVASGSFSGADYTSQAGSRMMSTAPVSVFSADYSSHGGGSRAAGTAPASLYDADYASQAGSRVVGTVPASSAGDMVSIAGASTYDPQLAAHYRKTREALGHGHGASSSVSSLPAKTAPEGLVVVNGGEDQPGIIYQHTDGGAGPSVPVQELPPPYADRSGESASVLGEKVS